MQISISNAIGGGGGAKGGVTPPFSNTKSIQLDGVDDFVNIGTTSLGITNAISISAWVKIPTTNTGGNWALNWRGGTRNNWQFVIWNTDGAATLVTSSGLTPNDNQWHHILATYDGTSNANGIKLYVGLLQVPHQAQVLEAYLQ